jgi:ATP-dependent Clp endopeptidase proteolytic subunit ClpP
VGHTNCTEENPEIQHSDGPVFVISEETDQDPIKAEFFAQHSHYLQGDVNYESIGQAVQWIIAENLKPLPKGQKTKLLTLYINSNGGDLYNAFALIDMMHCSKYPVRTIGIGNVMSAAALILACGKRGERYVAKNTGILTHQFYSDMEGKEHELKAGMRELELCRVRVYRLLTDYCRISERVVKKKLLQQSDVWLTAEEAVAIKLADKIFTSF